MWREIRARIDRWRKRLGHGTGVQWLRPLEGVIAIILVATGLYQLTGLSDDLRNSQSGAQWRLAWVVCALALACALVWTARVSVATIRTCLRTARSSDAEAWWDVTAVIGVAIAIVLVVLWRTNPHLGVGTATTDRFTDLIALCAAKHIRLLLSIGNVGTALTLFSVTMSCCSLVLPLEHRNASSAEKRIRAYQTMLYSASALLVVGVLEMYVLQRWGASYSANCSENASPSLAESLAFAIGSFYTLTLVALFLPVAIVHDGWMTTPDGPASSDPTNEKIPRSPLRSLATLGAMSLPVVTSVATALLKNLLGLKGP